MASSETPATWGGHGVATRALEQSPLCSKRAVQTSRQRMEIDGPETSSWSAALTRVGMSLTQDRADALRSHGVFRSVTDTSMVIIKRDERRYWTATAAREDAEATTLQAMQIRTE